MGRSTPTDNFSEPALVFIERFADAEDDAQARVEDLANLKKNVKIKNWLRPKF